MGKGNQNKLKKVPQRNNQSRQLIAVEQTWSAPLPPPEILERFEKACPGSAKIIVERFEGQSKHRLAIENKVISSDTRNELIGLIFAGIFGAICLFIVGMAIYLERNIEAFTVFFTEITVFVGMFIYGKKQSRAEREAKEQMYVQKKS
jgi:uncharacterized membrane protein